MVSLETATPPEVLRGMSRDLLARTKARQVNWVPVVVPDTEPPEYVYRLVLPDSCVTITYTTPMILSDFITLRFQNADGVTVDEWRVEAPPYDADAGETDESVDVVGDWRLMKGLFGEVHREATGYDRVISDVEKALASLGVIGLPAPAPVSAPARP